MAASVPMEEGCDVGVVIWGYNERERMPYSILESVELEFEGSGSSRLATTMPI